MLSALSDALKEICPSPHTDQVSDQVKSLLNQLQRGPLSAAECMSALGLSHRPTFRKNYLHPAIDAGLVERTIPEKPNSRLQKYRLSQLAER